MSLWLLGRRSTRLLLGATLSLAIAATVAVSARGAQGRGGAPGQSQKTSGPGTPPAAPAAPATGQGLTVGRNVNMVSGTKWPAGDPYLQRQNEPSIAASTRNPLHLLAGANDYRTVDVPFVDGADETGDAWLGLFTSLDGGQRWRSTLLPGYPQDTSPEGLASPLKGYGAGADPVVRAGTSGLLYYNGIVFDRGVGNRSAIFVARFIDNNNKEAGDPIAYLGTSLVAAESGADNVFLDKPWLAVDVPRGRAPVCRIETPGERGPIVQNIAAGNAYVAYTRFQRDAAGAVLASDIMFSVSSDCGATWSPAIRLNGRDDTINQGASIAIDPGNGQVYVAWRRISPTGTDDQDAYLVVRSPNFGRKFSQRGVARRFPRGRKHGLDPERYFEHKRVKDPVEVDDDLNEFDQATTGLGSALSFRTNAYPTLAIDGDGRLYMAWSERGFGAVSPGIDGDARIVVSTSTNGERWTQPSAVAEEGQPGHQIMPSLTFAGGRLLLVYYDLREDVSQVFGRFIDDRTAIDASGRRHTLDVRASIGAPGAVPVFEPSVPVSDYLFGFASRDPVGSPKRQLQFNPPNLPMFRQGTAPFMGDYIDVTPAPVFVPDGRGRWKYNTESTARPVFHAVWTDNRDVRQPAFDVDGDGNPWNDFTPPTPRGNLPPTDPNAKSRFDPSLIVPACDPRNSGARNQNIYTARLTGGLIVGSPGNSKPLDVTLQRAFVVFAQNATDESRTFRMTILSQPPGGHASFDQFVPAVVQIDVSTPPRSTATRSVYVTSTDRNASIAIDVAEIAYVGAPGAVAGGLGDAILLNPDIENPDIENPDIENPDIENPDIENAEVYNPDIENPDIENPDIENPDIENPDIENPDIENPDIENPDIENPDIENIVVANPDIENPDIENPDIENPDIENPDIENPDIENPDIENGAIADISWSISNVGNTTSAFNVNLFLAQETAKLCPPGSDGTVSDCINVQLILRKTYTTPTATACAIQVQTHNVLVANIPNPRFVTPSSTGLPPQNDPSQDNATLWLAPGESGRITLRVIDPDRSDNVTYINGEGEEVSIDPTFAPTDPDNGGGVVTPVLQSQNVNTDDAARGVTTPPIVTPSASSIFFVQQPTTSVVDAPITPAVRVQVRDRSGAVLPGVPVALALGTQPAGAVLSGTLSRVTDGTGQAAFDDLRLNIGGVYTLVASNPASGSAASAVFRIGCEFPTCGPPTPYGTPGGAGAYGIALADFDLDGDPDVVATSNTTNDLFLFTAAGDGTFSAGSAIAVAAGGIHSPALVATGDVNNDGQPDLVVANYDIGQGVTVVHGDGLGGFTSAVTTPLADLYTFDIALADVDGDGWTDIVTGGYNSLNPAVSENLFVLLNDQTGAFPPGNVHTYPAAGEMSRIVVADFNGDALPDVAGTDARSGGAASHVMSIMINDDGEFSLASTIPVGDAARVRAVGDLNGDGNDDLGLSEVPVGFSTARLAVFYGDGTGAFGPAVEVVPASSSVAYATSGDFNGDGRADLAVGNVTTGGISFLLGDGAGTFVPSTDIVIGSHANQFVPADLNGDGTTDLVVVPLGGEDILVLLNNCGDGRSVALSVSTSDVQDPVDEGHDVVVTFTVTNGGPDDATGVVLTSRLPTVASSNGATVPLPVVSAGASQGSCAWLGTGLRCTLGAIGSGDTAEVAVTVTSLAGGTITISGTALAEQSDPDTSDNTASETTTVNDVGQSFVVTNTNDSGTGSLRQALNLANADAGFDAIRFTIPGTGPHTIAPASRLPAITAPVSIDGQTQPTAVGWPITIDGTNAGAGAIGFEMNGNDSIVHYVSVVNFPSYAFLVRGTGNEVVSSLIGTDRDMQTGVGNQFGVYALYASDAWVAYNVISGNHADGVLVVGGSGNRIEHNTIGLTFNRAAALPNQGNGVTSYDGSTNTLISDNDISGNVGWGIDLQHSGALAQVTGTRIINNRIGLDGSGNFVRFGPADFTDGVTNWGPVDRGNRAGGVRLHNAPNTQVGAAGAGNVISGNSVVGVRVEGAVAGVRVQGNKIGTDVTGTLGRGNIDGLAVAGAALIGGTAAGEGNLVSANVSDGLRIFSPATLEGNFIGTDVTGMLPLGNGVVPFAVYPPCCHSGVQVENTTGVVIGGPAPGARNVISGNHTGLWIGAAPGILIEGNLVGPNAAATGFVPNEGDGGVALYGTQHAVVRNNDISGNTALGGIFADAGTTGSLVEGNTLTANANGALIFRGSATNGNTFRSNSIHDNGGLGIDLGWNGVTGNDGAGDTDAGPNGYQNYPVLGAATTTDVWVSLASAASAAFTVELYSSPAADPSGYGEGRTPMGSVVVTTDAGGNAGPFLFAFPSPIPAGHVVTATATDAAGNTSEFSHASSAGPVTLVGPVGGAGGSAFGPYDCAAGSVATAIRGGAGDNVDRVELSCRPLGPAGFGAEAFAGAGGGGGGTPYDLSCPAGLVLTGVSGVSGAIVGFPDTNVVGAIAARCSLPTALASPPSYTSPTAGTPGGRTPFTLDCPSGQAVTGMQGRGGVLIDQLLIRCQ